MREAGATAAQELAFTLADAIAYVRGGRRPRASTSTTSPAGCASSSPPGASSSRRSPSSGRPAGCGRGSCASGSARTNPRSMMCRFHVQTAGSSLTAQSIDNNVVRTTVQALAAVLGGAQSLHTNSRDEALALPTAEAARLALRTQQILAYESGVTETPDPLGRLVLRRDADERARGGRLGRARRDRGARRDARRDRGRLPAAPDPGVGLPRPAADRVGRPGRRRGQPLPRRRRARRRRSSGSTRTASAARSRASGASGPSATRRPGRPRSSGSTTAARGRREPACPPLIEAVRRLRDGRRDQRPAAGRLGRAPRADHGLSDAVAGDGTGRDGPVADLRATSYARRHEPIRRRPRPAAARDPPARPHPPRRGRRPRPRGVARRSTATSSGCELETILPIPTDRVTDRVPADRRVEDRARRADRRHDRGRPLPRRRRGRASTTSASRSPTSPRR